MVDIRKKQLPLSKKTSLADKKLRGEINISEEVNIRNTHL
jgi:hypothetical protein